MAKNRFFALYGSWGGLVWCKILPRGVGTICPYFWEVIFLQKSRSVNYVFCRACFSFLRSSHPPQALFCKQKWRSWDSMTCNLHVFHEFIWTFIDFDRFSYIFISIYIYIYIYIYMLHKDKYINYTENWESGPHMKNTDLTSKYHVKVTFHENYEMIPRSVRSFCL